MTDNLKRNVSHLLKFVKLKKRESKKALKSASASFINALSEIALNARDGVVKVAKRVQNSKLVKALARKDIPLKQKYRLLCAAAAPAIIHSLVSCVIGILKDLQNG